MILSGTTYVNGRVEGVEAQTLRHLIFPPTVPEIETRFCGAADPRFDCLDSNAD